MYCLLAYQLFSRARFLCRVYGDGHITEGVLRSHLTPASYDPARRFLGRPAPGNQPDRFRRRRRVLGPGLFIAWRYIGDWGGLTGTGYVVMVLIKAMLLATGLILGAMNFFLVGGWPRQRETVTTPLRVRAFVEAETGLGITVLLAAASLTSLPPSTSSPIGPPRGRGKSNVLSPRCGA